MADADAKPAKPEIKFAETARSRMGTFDLDWPLEVDGVTVEAISLRRLTGAEVAQLQDSIEADGNSDEAMIAQFADQPVEVIAALDQDDIGMLKEKLLDFLPRRLRDQLEEAQSRSPAGDTSSPTSPSPSSGAGTNS